MKKSELYQLTMETIIDADLDKATRLEILTELMDKKESAEWLEAQEEKEAQADVQ